jgi:hypothetical protein
LADGLADHGERLLPDFTIRHDVIRAVEIKLVDSFFRNELVDLDRALALNRDGLKLFRLDFKVSPLPTWYPLMMSADSRDNRRLAL